MIGLVSLVGAGPGDPELITLRGFRRLQSADVIVHDRLVGAEVLAYGQPSAEYVDVGKAPGGRGYRQEEINTLLIRLARQAKQVVRLKGGDPLVFGRGGEEALALAAAGVPFEIVPGVSSALAGPAAAGIPVTHRGLAASVTIATGHAQGHGVVDHDWAALARLSGTLVFLMALETLEEIVAQLVAHGRRADEPAAMIQSATTDDQRTVYAPLRDLARAVRRAGLVSPAILVIGPTVPLADVIGATCSHLTALVLAS